MKTLLFLQTNSIVSKETIEYVIALAKDLNVNLKFTHIHYPDVLFSASLATNMELFQTPSQQMNYTVHEIEKTESHMKQLKKEGKIDRDLNFEYLAGVPEVILKTKLLNGEFDMLAMRNEYHESTMNPYQPLKNIVKNVKCPIWIIPHRAYHGIDSALYATDYQEQDVKSTQLLLQTVHQLRQITFIHLTDNPDFIQTIKTIGFKTYIQDKTNFQNIQCLVMPTNEKKSIPQYVKEVVSKEHSQFIIALKENKNLFQQVFYRSFTTKLLKGINELVLILHGQDSMQEEEKNRDEL